MLTVLWHIIDQKVRKEVKTCNFCYIYSRSVILNKLLIPTLKCAHLATAVYCHLDLYRCRRLYYGCTCPGCFYTVSFASFLLHPGKPCLTVFLLSACVFGSRELSIFSWWSRHPEGTENSYFVICLCSLLLEKRKVLSSLNLCLSSPLLAHFSAVGKTFLPLHWSSPALPRSEARCFYKHR